MNQAIKTTPGPSEPELDATEEVGTRRTTRRVVGVVVAVVLSSVSMWAAAKFEREPPPAPAVDNRIKVEKDKLSLAPDAPQWKVLKLGAAQPVTTYWTDPVPARVKIDETRASKIGTPLPGRVVRVGVELGQRVKAGAVLFEVATPEISTLRAEKEKAAVDAETAKATLERVKAMVAARALPAKEELTAQQAAKQAEVSLRLASSKLAALHLGSPTDPDFDVISPRDGVVVEKNVLPGQEVTSEAGGLIVVADLSTVWVLADLFEGDATNVKEGGSAEVTSPSLPSVKLTGVVEMVSSVVDPTRHTVPIRVRLPNSEHTLRPNVYAQVRLQIPPPEGAVEVAATALVTDGNHQYLYVEEQNGKFARREVVAGSAHDGKLSIFSGLKQGESIVEEGGILLDNQLSLSE